jgi:hypothetical protein
MLRHLTRAALGATLGLVTIAAAAQAPAGLVDRAQLLDDLRVLSADDMQGRLPGTPGSEKARAFIASRFTAVGIAPIGESYLRPFTFSGSRPGINVVGRIAGARTPGRAIVVTAHYDHLGVRNGQVFNGANDNASGAAALVAMGAYFRAHPPAHTILFAALDAEELGLHGARALLADPPVDRAAIAVNVNLDMIGRDANDELWAVGTRAYPFLRPLLERASAAAPLTLRFGHDDPSQREDWTRDSDHFAFHERKIPFVYLGVEDAAQHHRATDDFETMTHDFYVRAVETAIHVVRVFDAELETITKATKGTKVTKATQATKAYFQGLSAISPSSIVR